MSAASAAVGEPEPGPGEVDPYEGSLLVPGLGMRWSHTPVRDWIMVVPELRGTPFHLYCIMRSLLWDGKDVDPGDDRSKLLTLDQLCWLMPGPNNKPCSLSTMKVLLQTLDDEGLVVNPDGERLVTSTGKGKIQVSRRFQINELPELPHVGWRSPWAKLQDYREDWRTNAPKPPIYTAPKPPEPAGPPKPVEGCACGCVHTPGRQAGGGNAGQADDQAPGEAGQSPAAADQVPGPGSAQAHGSGQSAGGDAAAAGDDRTPDGSLVPSAPAAGTGVGDGGGNDGPDAETLAELVDKVSGAEDPDVAVAQVVDAWSAARGDRAMPPLAPRKVADSARKMLDEGISVGVLCEAAAVMAPKMWTDFDMHLQRWAPSVPQQRGANGTTSVSRSAAAIQACGRCDESGFWFRSGDPDDPGERCTHPDAPPGRPARPGMRAEGTRA